MIRKGFTLVEIMLGLFVLGLALGTIVTFVRTVRTHEAAVAAYSQKVTLEKYGADIITSGDLVRTNDENVQGVTIFPELGALEKPLETEILATYDAGIGMVDELVALKGADGMIAVGTVSRLPDSRTPTPGPTIDPRVSITASSATVEFNENFTINWSSSDMENGVLVREIDSSGNWTEISRNVSGSRSITKSAKGTFTYEIFGWVKGKKYSEQVQVDINESPVVTTVTAEVTPNSLPFGENLLTFKWGSTNAKTYLEFRFIGPDGNVTMGWNRAGWYSAAIWRDSYGYETQIGMGSYFNGWAKVPTNWDTNIVKVGVNRFEVRDPGSGATASATYTVEPPLNPPEVWINVAATAAVGAQYTVTWGSKNVSTATISGPNLSVSGSAGKSGSRTLISNTSGLLTYTITSSGKTAIATIDIGGNSPIPSAVWIRSQSSVAIGATYDVEWGSNKVSSVKVTGPTWSSTKLSGSKQETATTLGDVVYKNYATDGSGERATWTVHVYDPRGSGPWVSIGTSRPQITKGETYTVSWTSGNCTNGVVVTGGGVSSINPNGSVNVTPTSVGTYTHTIVGQPGGVTQSVQVEVVAGSGGPDGGATVQIWANKTSVIEGENFTISWRAAGCTPYVVARKPDPYDDRPPVGWNDGCVAIEGSWTAKGTQYEGDWPKGYYTFGITGSGADSKFVRVELKRRPESSVPYRKYEQTGITLVGGAYYHVISIMTADDSWFSDNKKERKEDRVYRFTDWWYPFLSTLKSGFDDQIDDQNNAKYVAEILEQKVRGYSEAHRADFETLFRQPDGSIAYNKPSTAEELKTTFYFSAGRINGMATIAWGPKFKDGPTFYWGGQAYPTTWHEWPVTTFTIWRNASN